MAMSSRPSSSRAGFAKPDVRELLQKLTVKPDARFTARYSAEVPTKSDKLAAGNATEKSRQKIKNVARSLENIEVSDLMKVLSELNP